MRRRAKKLTVILIIATVLVGLVATAAWAKATTPVYGEIYAYDVLDPGVLTLTDEGAKIRGYVSREYLDGDLEGYILAYIDGNYTSPGNGEIYGAIEWFPEGNSGPAFVGRFSGVWTGGVFDGYWVLHGIGEYEGQKMHIHNYGDFPQVCEGYILDPHGE